MRIRLKRAVHPAVPVDIAPLIDVVFLQLIYFMLTSSFILHPGVRVSLPKAATGGKLSASNVVLTLTKDHVIYLDRQVVTLAELRSSLKQANRERPILIRADRYAYVEKLIELWDLCRDAGYSSVHIATLSE